MATIYTNHEFYTNNYLMRRKAVIGATTFSYYAYLATKEITFRTLGNIDSSKKVSEDVQMCCCELAEYLYKAEEISEDIPAGISSESTGKQSISYASDSDRKATKKADIEDIIKKSLADTGLLYCGVRR